MIWQMSNLFDINHKKIVITAGTGFWGICRSLKIHCRKRARKDHAPVRAKRFRKPLGCRTREEIQKRKYQIEEAGLVWAVVERVPIHEEIKCWPPCIKKPIRDIQESAG